MRFSFIYAADLHPASPLVNIAARDQESAARLATVSRGAFMALVDQAIAHHFSFLIVASDIYDGQLQNLVGGGTGVQAQLQDIVARRVVEVTVGLHQREVEGNLDRTLLQ